MTLQEKLFLYITNKIKADADKEIKNFIKKLINFEAEISCLKSANKLYKKEIVRLKKVEQRQNRIIAKMEQKLK